MSIAEAADDYDYVRNELLQSLREAEQISHAVLSKT